ncbi:neuromedin-U receptor 2-like [Amphiura filiformis]|uniref:neuromedin-U receptor 2-like n=1 Tax=Amphiura filiformis TaxID=82378 RepID=UPI003B224253
MDTSTTSLDSCDDGILNYTYLEDAERALDEYRWSGADAFITKVILPIVVSIGVLGNLAFLFTVARVSRMRTVTNYYLVNLAVADMLFLLITMSAQIHKYRRAQLRGSVPYTSEVGCWGAIFPIFLSYFTSVLLVTFVSLERYYSICKPVEHRLLHGKAHTLKLIVVAWIVGIVLAILSTPRFGKLKQECILWPNEEEYKDLPTRYQQCFMINIGLSLLSEIIQFALFCIALTISCITYFNLIKTLSKNTLVVSEQQAQRNQQVRNQVARILIIIGVIFFCCQIPSRVINLHKFVRIVRGTHEPSYGIIFEISFGLLLLNSATNPFVYGFGSRLYREAFYKAFGVSTCRRRKTTERPVSSGDLSRRSGDLSRRSQSTKVSTNV